MRNTRAEHMLSRTRTSQRARLGPRLHLVKAATPPSSSSLARSCPPHADALRVVRPATMPTDCLASHLQGLVLPHWLVCRALESVHHLVVRLVYRVCSTRIQTIVDLSRVCLWVRKFQPAIRSVLAIMVAGYHDGPVLGTGTAPVGILMVFPRPARNPPACPNHYEFLSYNAYLASVVYALCIMH